MIDKFYDSPEAAVSDIHDGATVLIGSDPVSLSAQVADPDRVIWALHELSDSGVALADFSLGQPTLDEVFLALTGRPADGSEENEVEGAVA